MYNYQYNIFLSFLIIINLKTLFKVAGKIEKTLNIVPIRGNLFLVYMVLYTNYQYS